jgi:hypothetical protein
MFIPEVCASMSKKKIKRKALERTPKEQPEEILNVCLRFLEEIADSPAFSSCLNKSEAFRLLLLRCAGRQRPKIDGALKKAFESERESIRLTAAQLLAISSSKQALAFLLQKAASEEPVIRYDALMGLVKALPESRAVEAIWKARNDGDQVIRDAVTSAISQLPPAKLEAIAQVRQRIADTQEAAKKAAQKIANLPKSLTLKEFYQNTARLNLLRARSSTRERPDRDELYPK